MARRGATAMEQAGYGSRVTVPTTLVAPGPGRLALAFTKGLLVVGTQNAEASLIAFGTPAVSAPAGAPTSRTSCASVPAFTHVPPPQSVSSAQPFPSFVPPLQ